MADLYQTNKASVATDAEMWGCSTEQALARIKSANEVALQRAVAIAAKFRELTGLEPVERCAGYAAARAGALRLVRGADGVCRLFDGDATLWEGIV